jgi:hypothetical protein
MVNKTEMIMIVIVLRFIRLNLFKVYFMKLLQVIFERNEADFGAKARILWRKNQTKLQPKRTKRI